MERLNKKTLSFPAMVFTRALATLGVVLTLAACGKDNGGGSAPIVVGINGCQNCGAITAPTVLTTFNSQAASGAFALTNMQVYAQAGLIQPNASGYNYKWYNGPIAIQGQLTVPTAFHDTTNSGCVVPAGTYYLQTYSVGQLGNLGADVLVPSLMTTTGNIELKIESAGVAGGGFVDEGRKLYAKVSIVRANGYVCSALFADSIL
ncbi:MAG: hypothetical protein OM95_02285 [Bdellovibrio sp. ArHS]|uniref:hypothetical protein n=1 Tax=Bdellovibrio sp. ArHS TaxID=1569284 RepID=UPI000582E2FA|nr:hypothetical protein [Bdellovibrio sp. ArHS]KHD89583.1 MAG: hypothetical protein OM95_02285 [Bdellovibrio sp. ArHS]